jgi:hypothetical protein
MSAVIVTCEIIGITNSLISYAVVSSIKKIISSMVQLQGNIKTKK